VDESTFSVPEAPCLPERASMARLRNDARNLQRKVRAGDGEALELVTAIHPQASALVVDPTVFPLSGAQLVTARLHGFASWPRLKAVVEEVERWTAEPDEIGTQDDPVDEILRLACLNYGSDSPPQRIEAARRLMEHRSLTDESLHLAAAAGDPTAVRTCLGVKPGSVKEPGGPFGWEPLMYLCYSRMDDGRNGEGFVEAADLLLTAGADPNTGYLWHGLIPPFTALTGAFGEGEDKPNQPPHQAGLRLARLLLERGADANDGQALYNRQWSDSDEHLELLLSFGLGKGSGGPWHQRLGETLSSPRQMLDEELVKACAAGRVTRARLLLEAGADPNGLGDRHPVHRGMSAYELALRSGNPELIELLFEAGGRAEPLSPVETLVAALLGDPDAARRLVESDPDLVPRALAAEPALVARAVEAGRADSVRLLVDLGWDVNHLGRVTAVHQAVWSGDLEMVKLLLALGADPTIEDSAHHSTPLGWARHGHHSEIEAYLTGLDG
jgi:hypothetical protein